MATFTRNPVAGAWIVSDMIGSHLVSRAYYGYTKRQAGQLFRAEMAPKPEPKPTEPPTRVIFRMERGEYAQVLAIFPDLPADTAERFTMCYAHVGQHSSCDYAHVMRHSRAATPAEYEPLRKELESTIGYTLRIVQRRGNK